jgi:hypothetical protein
VRNFSGGFFYKTSVSANTDFYSVCAAYASDWFSLTYSFDFGKVSNVMHYSPDVHEVSLWFKVNQRPKSSYFQNQGNSRRKVQNMPYINYL